MAEGIITRLTLEEVRSIYNNYMVKDFPDSERKPLVMIEKGIKKGKYQCLGYREENQLLAYAIFVQKGRDFLFDYLAVIDGNRNSGIGANFLQKIKEYFADSDSLMGEVEDPACARNEEEKILQERRYNFYLRNGYIDTGVRVKLFGVDYIVLEMKKDRPHNVEEIKKIYKAHYRSMLPVFLYIGNVRVKKLQNQG